MLLSGSAGESDGHGSRDSGVQEPAPRGRQRALECLPEEGVAEAEAVAVGDEQPQLAELFELFDERQRVDVEDVGEVVGAERGVEDRGGQQDAVAERPALAAACAQPTCSAISRSPCWRRSSFMGWTLIGIGFIVWFALVLLFTPRIDYHVSTPLRLVEEEEVS